ncbi:MAG: DedA family protein [Proteobacteria bacterium]|nr:MAG: DedA family protein [Pseudomonadota bacterium]
MDTLIALFQQFIHIIFHLDLYINNWITLMGPGIYVILFLVIFCETGLVVTPFLPGDSFLFALGALTAVDNAYLDITILLITLNVAAILGDAANYSIGRYAGPKIFRVGGRFLNQKHLVAAQRFYEKHGGKAIIIARFAPILRTFAPFVAGIAEMNYRRFAAYNVVGGLLWVCSFLLAGRFFGNLPIVKTNFHIVIVAIIVLSLVPVLVEFIKARREAKNAQV